MHSIFLLKLDEYGNNTAILKGIAVDLQTQILFPAIFAWGQYEDFKSQIKDKYQRIMVELKDKLYTKLYHYILFLFCGFFANVKKMSFVELVETLRAETTSKPD